MHCTFWGDPLLGAVCSNTFMGLQFTGKQAFSGGGVVDAAQPTQYLNTCVFKQHENTNLITVPI